jgi:excinuclease ABC subunit C
MDNSEKLREKISAAPDSPGVYLMSGRKARVLYVGKAKSLKKRLLNYLGKDLPVKTRALMAKVEDIEFRRTSSEATALLMEFKLIHKLRPRYNISLKDDKSYPFVRISRDVFPLIQIVRKKEKSNGRCLGPYTDVKLLKSVLKIIRHEFAYRSCRHLPKKSCIYHRINLCPAPCLGKISREDYNHLVDNIVLILEGKGDLLIRKLTKSMRESSAARDFETAARIRDQIINLSRISEQADGSNRKNELELLKISLNLERPPVRIEGFDISNIAGNQAVGSMVSFYNGRPDKNNYRRFRIKSVSGINDYKMLAEVLARRYTRLLREKKALPDLLLIDGGKGHLLTAAAQLEALNLRIPLVSIAKPRKKARGFIRGEKRENIYSSQPGKLTVDLVKDGAALNLIRRVRDEAHRFALAYHHLLRKKALIGR